MLLHSGGHGTFPWTPLQRFTELLTHPLPELRDLFDFMTFPALRCGLISQATMTSAAKGLAVHSWFDPHQFN